jgi:hypothetical protein
MTWLASPVEAYKISCANPRLLPGEECGPFTLHHYYHIFVCYEYYVIESRDGDFPGPCPDEATQEQEDENHPIQPSATGVLWLTPSMPVVDVHVYSVEGWEAGVAVFSADSFNAVFAPGAPLGDYEVYVNGQHVASFTLVNSEYPQAHVTWYDAALVTPAAYAPAWAF